MDKKINSLEQRIAVLEQKLAALESSGPDQETRLVAPVKIVDRDGKLIAEIVSETNDNAIRIYNSKGQAVASLAADGTESGYLAIRNKHGKLVGHLDVERYGARLQLQPVKDGAGGLALFGGDADESGGGINIIPADNGGGISLWAQSGGGEIRIEDSAGNEQIIDASIKPDSDSSAD